MAKIDPNNTESGRRITSDNARDDSDLPPDSIVVPISQEIIWQDLGTAYDSEDSTRGGTNPKSHSNPFPWSKTASSSNRVAATNLNATTSSQIIAAKIQRPGFIQCHRPPSIFPKGRSSGSKKTGLTDTEPGSPKVSCLGHVLSERERVRRRRQREARREREFDDQGVFCCTGFSSILPCGGDRKRGEPCTDVAEVGQPLPEKSQASKEVEVKKAVEEIQKPEKVEIKSFSEKEAPRSTEVEVEVAPPAISAMKRFSSGRRAASWGDDVAVAENQGRVEEAKESN
ncbi:hypothetical protein LUZ61_011317 [Rhynchospora tenuis]|uniref:Uncharacterized protein n=1 Tax=Rhynchospora tenuis TaxID=198213 RepID=A0AAD6A0T6_9POAL|nr:hypothetical protein LUZ61_011317 [Rhynchospora tenuis]